jgi:hypothetical protein
VIQLVLVQAATEIGAIHETTHPLDPARETELFAHATLGRGRGRLAGTRMSAAGIRPQAG